MARKATRRTTKKRTTKKKTTKRKPARKSAKRKTTRRSASSKKKKPAKRKATSRKKSPARKKAPAKAKKAEAKPIIKKVRKASRPKNARTLSYTQSEFVENVRAFCGLQKRSEAKEICQDIALFIEDSLRKGYRIPLLGLGKMYVRKSKARMGRNPATGEAIHIPARKRVRFSVAKALKEAVL